MNRNLIACMAIAGLSVPLSANAIEVVGKKLEIYGKVHVSVDASDNDRAAPNDQSDVSVSSNSTRLGIKGEHAMDNGMTAFYQFEQEVVLDSGSGNFATRNSFVGLKGGWGSVLAGHHDTPFKDAASKWGMFGDTVADRRAILGASATAGNKMNQRGKNALMYQNKFGDVKLKAMYATDAADSASGALDNNDNAMGSIGLFYNTKNIYLAGAYENWDNLSVSSTGKTKGFRIMGGYKFGSAQIGAIYESIESDASADIERDAWGINGKIKVGSDMDIRAQFIQADDYKGVADSGATMMALGLFKKLDKQTQLYAAYTQTDNDVNAKYQGVDGGHGDEVKTDLGGTPNAFSVGVVYKF